MSDRTAHKNVLLTVGAQMPFDRLVEAVDHWAASNPQVNVYAQVGDSAYLPVTIETTRFIEPSDFRARIKWADLIVAHAGMGSILMALQYGKPIIVMPRRGDLRETRNDHQVATAVRFKAMGKVAVAMDEQELPVVLSSMATFRSGEAISDVASSELIDAISTFIHHH